MWKPWRRKLESRSICDGNYSRGTMAFQTLGVGLLRCEPRGVGEQATRVCRRCSQRRARTAVRAVAGGSSGGDQETSGVDGVSEGMNEDVIREERRSFLRTLGVGLVGLVAGTGWHEGQAVKAAQRDPKVCKNCEGTGLIVCDLCTGTGFWRATANNDPKLRYKGVVCPTCNGKGELVCTVCLGTGEAETRGMLRKRIIQTEDGRTLQS